MPHTTPTLRVALLVASVCLTGSALAADDAAPAADNVLSPDNPFAQPSTLAFEYPAVDRMRDTAYLPA